MPIYPYMCADHGGFDVEKRMVEAGRDEPCPTCGGPTCRVFFPVADVWHVEGSHKHSYTKYGSKLDVLNRAWSAYAGGEPPPPPATDKTADRDLRDFG